ncbi:vWA domain-containing protein [Trujillonella humicola]|uniref:vWA domain-containing protein n=1 Tax=Trujillonella humicola TaxID=3383699 RepID=UPI00390617F8
MAELPAVGAGPLAVGVTTALRRAGVPVAPDRAVVLARALRLVPPVDRSALYWSCRVALVTDRAQLPVFDAVFAALFDGLLDPADSRGDPTAPPAVGSEPRTRPSPPDDRPAAPGGPGAPTATGGGDGEADGDREALLAAASAEERLRHTSFADLDPGEVTRVRELVRRLVLRTPPRRSRRNRRSRRAGDALDLRRTVRAAQRTGGDPARLLHAVRRTTPRRLVLLCDVSGSMEPYTRIFLTLLQGAVAGARAEAFVFATRLTRLTRQLAGRDPDAALARAAAAAPDRAGGTRLAEAVTRFVADHGRRGLARGAVVVVLSDGWAQDDPDDVAEAMRRLRRLAHRIVWVNPRKAAPGYAPLVGGMAAALPFCDAFVSGHDLAALEDVVAAVAGPPGC